MSRTTQKMLRITCFAIATLGATAVITTVVTPDFAYAKNGNNGNGGGKSDNGNGGGASDNGKKSGKKSSSSKASSSKGASSKSKSGGLSLKKLFGKKKTKAVSRTKTVSRKSTKKSVETHTDELHASKLGKLNGAINSSPNAKLAHIRNGNFNGPVGLAAALAVADYNGGGIDQEALDAATKTLDLNQAAADLDAVAVTAGYADYADYLGENEAGSLNAELEALIAGAELPTEQEVTDATTTLANAETSAQTVADAEAALLAAWNKGDATDPNAEAILAKIRASLPTTEEVGAALASQEDSSDPLPEDDVDAELEADDDTEQLIDDATQDVIVELVAGEG